MFWPSLGMMLILVFSLGILCFSEETKGSEENQPAENKFIPLSERVLSCAAHPLSHNIIAGTEVRLVTFWLRIVHL